LHHFNVTRFARANVLVAGRGTFAVAIPRFDGNNAAKPREHGLKAPKTTATEGDGGEVSVGFRHQRFRIAMDQQRARKSGRGKMPV
jgi:hypothetical protein